MKLLFLKNTTPWMLCLACFGVGYSLSAHSQTSPSRATNLSGAPLQAASGGPTFAIRGFKVNGENPLSAAETSQALAPFLRTDANIDVLQKATLALETALREKGYGLHKVALPPQEVGDSVTLEIVKFAIGNVVIEGATRSSTENIRQSLPELQEGSTPNFRRLALQTAIANENPAKQVTVALKESAQADKIDATVQVKESRPWSLSVGLANTGSPASGRDRITFSGGHSNLFDRDHQFIAAYTTSIERTSDVKQLGLSYRIPFYSAGGVLALSATRSDVLGNFGAFSSNGAGQTLGVNYTLYAPAEGGRKSFFTLGLDDKYYEGAVVNGTKVSLDARSRPVSLGYTVRNESDSAYWSANADLAFNLGSGNANNLTSYSNGGLDTRVTTRAWKVLHAGASYTSAWASNWLWSARTQLQYSPNALISGEQFGLGGAASVRGASERALSGDSGLSAVLELTSPELKPGLRVVGFVDAGWLSSTNVAGTLKPAHDKLASVGLGVRYNHPAGVSLVADYGKIITGSSVPLTANSSAPQKGEDRLHINLLMRF